MSSRFRAAATSRGLAAWPAAAALALAAADARAGGPPYKLLPPDTGRFQYFGTDIAIDNGVILVGAPGFSDGGADGAAYLYDAATGDFLRELVRPADPLLYDDFGESVALLGGLAIVGAPLRHNDEFLEVGAAFLYDVATGALLATLERVNGANNERFGNDVALTSGDAIVGAHGVAHPGGHSGVLHLFDPDLVEPSVQIGPTLDAQPRQLARTVAALADRCVASAEIDGGATEEAALVFDTSTGQHLLTLRPDAESRSLFGDALAITPELILVGAASDDEFGDVAGAVYLFDASTGQPIAKLGAQTPAVFERFGRAVAAHQHAALIGAEDRPDKGDNALTAYLLDLRTRRIIDAVVAPDAGDSPGFGDGFAAEGLALDADYLVVGAHTDHERDTDAGAVYVFPAPGLPCSPADHAQPLGLLTIDDALAFIDAFLAQAPPADLAPPFGAHDYSDVFAFLAAFGQGCP